MSPTAPTTTITPTLRRRRGLTEQAAVAAVDQACRRLSLPTIRAILDEALTVGAHQYRRSFRLHSQRNLGSFPSCEQGRSGGIPPGPTEKYGGHRIRTIRQDSSQNVVDTTGPRGLELCDGPPEPQQPAAPADARSRGALRTYACNAGGPAPKGAGPPAQTVPGNAGAVVVQPAPRSGPPSLAGPWGGTGHPRLYPATSSVSSASSVTSTAPPSFRSR
jgi:hypothetical protein